MSKLRNAVRFPLHLPINLQSPQPPGVPALPTGETENISSQGVLFHCDVDYPVGSKIQFTISMPGKSLGSDRDVKVECTGYVVRSSPSDGRIAVGAVIDEYRISR